MKRNILFTLLAAVGLMFTACSSTPPERVTYTIEMSEYAFKLDSIEVKVGQEVTLELVNMGQLVHELMIGRDVMMMQNRPNGYQTDMFESAGVEPIITSTEGEELDHEQTHGHEAGHTGYMLMLMENGGKATMTFTVTEEMVGEWEIGCFEQEGVHYEAGMLGKFVVAP